MSEWDNPFVPEEPAQPEMCKRCWEADCPGTCGYTEKEPVEPKKDLTRFPYFDIYKVRNMYFAVDIPVFTALESQDVESGFHRFKTIYCCN